MPKPKTELPPSAVHYPEGGPGRQLKARLAAGEVLVGGMIEEYLRPSLMKLYRHAGFDFVYLESEHSQFDPAALADTVLAGRDSGLPVIAKTPQLERAEVTRLLESGAVGIQLPRTESREEIEQLRSYIKFPPAGTRAYAPGYGNSDYVAVADKRAWLETQNLETTLVVHIETRAGYENAEEIVTTPGVDVVYLGPGDFAVEMGQPGDWDHPDVTGPMEEILELCRRHGVPFGTTTSSVEAAEQWVSRGALFFECVDERSLIIEGATRLVDGYRRFSQPRG